MSAAKMASRVLWVVDDNPEDFVRIRDFAERATGPAPEVRHIDSLAALDAALVADPLPDAILVDCEPICGFGIQEALRIAREAPRTPVIAMFEHYSSAADDSVLAGDIADCICKTDLNPERLNLVLLSATARRRHFQQLYEQAHFDSLTGLANRAMFFDRMRHGLDRCQRSGEHAALLLIDLDDFKHVNDTFGHDCGDVYLQEVAQLLRSVVRDSDTVARLGGDEFVIFVEGLRHAEAAVQVVEKVARLGGENIVIHGKRMSFSTSIGVSLYSPETTRFSSERLMKAADTALYRAKAQGKNGYCIFTDELDREMVDNLNLDRELRAALLDDQFYLVYQPIVDLNDGSVAAVEALLRWQHPVRGEVLPADFLPALEKLGLMPRAGEFVVRDALRRLGHWRAHGQTDLRLQINVSASQLNGLGLVGVIAEELERNRIPPEQVYLELTESMLFEPTATISREINRLRALGLRFAIDDFGTGYGTYSYLKRFPIESIKIDKSFVDNLDSDGTDLAIVRSIVALGEELDIDITVEGVENYAQLQQLHALGARRMQGFLFHRPVHADNVIELRRRRASMRSVAPASAAQPQIRVPAAYKLAASL